MISVIRAMQDYIPTIRHMHLQSYFLLQPIRLIQDIFGNIDDNADGGISFEEFVAAMQKRAKKVKE